MTHPTCLRYTARSDNQGLALIFGCRPDQVVTLVDADLYPYLNPDAPFAVKWGSTARAFHCVADPKWVLAATRVLAGQNAKPLAASPPNASPSRSRGHSSHRHVDHSGAVTAQWMIDSMIASMLVDKASGSFLPAMLDDTQVAQILGFRKHDLPPLRRENVLECLNGKDRRARKLHCREYIISRVTEEAWLARATLATIHHWRAKNARKSHGRAAI